MAQLNIVTQNVRSLGVSKMTAGGHIKLRYLCQRTPQENTIIILTEVNLLQADLKKLQMKVPKPFRVLATNFSGRGSGILILCTKEISKVYLPQTTDCVVRGRVSHLRVKLCTDEEIFIYSVYLSCDENNSIRQLQELQNHIVLNGLTQSSSNTKIVIAGDFNFDAKVHQSHHLREGKLSQIVHDVHALDVALVFSDERPTWIGPGNRAMQKSSRIDRVYTNDFTMFKSFASFYNPYSDHRAISISTEKKSYERVLPRWQNHLFADPKFKKDAETLVCEVILDNSLIDVSTLTEAQKNNTPYIDKLEFPEIGEQKLPALPVYSLIMTKLLALNHKQARFKRNEIKNSVKNFETAYDQTFSNFLNMPNSEIANELETIKRNARNSFTLLTQSRDKTNYIKNLYAEGKSNSTSFRRFKSKKTFFTRF